MADNTQKTASSASQVERLVMCDYVDRNGKPVSIGDILYYDEGKGFAKGIHEVVNNNGVISGKTHHYNDLDEQWATTTTDDIVALEHYTGLMDKVTLQDAEVIGNIFDNPEMLLKSWAETNKPIYT